MPFADKMFSISTAPDKFLCNVETQTTVSTNYEHFLAEKPLDLHGFV